MSHNQIDGLDIARGDAVRHITVDAEHFSVRFLVPIVMIGATILTHLIGMAILNRVLESSVNPACIMLPIDIVVLLGSGYGAERVLKRLLPSHRSATLSDEELVLTDARQKPPQVDRIWWDQTVNVRAWRFTVRRRTRVPRGWYCMAMQLLQDETAVILYTFMPPQQAENIRGFDEFTRLRPRKETESNTDLRAIAEQRRLLKLEDARWNNGAEISQDDFMAIWDKAMI